MSKDMYPKFISDIPCGDDLLAGGSQRFIAEKIAEIIQSDDHKCKLIGIDGSWGSGKSNIVKIIEKENLIKDSHIFIYDAWGHQEDKQRRAFLEELTNDLIDKKHKNGLLDAKVLSKNFEGKEESIEWKDKLRNLLSNKRITHNKVYPVISNGVVILFLLILLTPIIGNISDSFTCLSSKLIITLLPLIIAYIYYSIKSKEFPVKLESIRQDIFIAQKSDMEKIEMVTISESEPTVNDFNNWMNDLAKSLKKKLIIVIDNMDRLPEDKVKELWSSIHTFFSEKEYEKIYVIIPFDRNHVKEAFCDNPEKANHFIDKTFSVIFSVPPPIMTDWQDFFKIKYKEAFGENEDDEYSFVLKVFDYSMTSITPRQIISFINELVSKRISIKDQVKLRYVALYIRFKGKILEDPPKAILDLTFFSEKNPISSLFKGDSEINNQISAIIYNIPIESASQVSLIREMEVTLRDIDKEKFNSFAKHKYFIRILGSAINNERMSLFNPIITLGNLDRKLINEDDNIQLQNIWDTLCGSMIKGSFDQKFIEPFGYILLNASQYKKEAFLKKLIYDFQHASNFNGMDYFNSLNELENFIADKKLNLNIFDYIAEIKWRAEVFIDYLDKAKENYKKYKLICDENLLIDYYLTKIPNEIQSIESIKYLIEDFDFTLLINKIEELIENDEINENNLGMVYDFYQLLVGNKKLLKMPNDETIYNSLKYYHQQNELNTPSFDFALAMMIARGSDFITQSGVYNTYIQSGDIDLAMRLSKKIVFFINYGDLLKAVTHNPYKLPVNVVITALDFLHGDSKLDYVKILPLTSDITNNIGWDYIQLIEILNDWADIENGKITPENINILITDIDFINNIVSVDNKFTKHLIVTFNKHLNTIDEDIWSVSLSDQNSYYFNVLNTLIQANQYKPHDNLINAFNNCLILIAEGSVLHSNHIIWQKIFENTDQKKIIASIRIVRDKFISNQNITQELFMFFSDMFLMKDTLSQRPGDVTRAILTPVIKYDYCLKFICNNSDYFVDIIINANEDAYPLKEFLKRFISENPDQILIAEFGKRIGIDIENHD